MTDNGERYRAERRSAIKAIEAYLAQEKAEAEQAASQTAARVAVEIANLRAEKARLASPLPEPDLCAECWFQHGRQIQLLPQPKRKPGVDRMLCPECRGIEERGARR
jgi:hypothetical protein